MEREKKEEVFSELENKNQYKLKGENENAKERMNNKQRKLQQIVRSAWVQDTWQRSGHSYQPCMVAPSSTKPTENCAESVKINRNDSVNVHHAVLWESERNKEVEMKPKDKRDGGCVESL